MSLLGSNLYCVPYGDGSRRKQAKKRRGRKPLTSADRLRAAVLERHRYISLAEHMHELSLPDHDAVLQLVLADDDLDVMDGACNGTKIVIPAKEQS